MPAHRLAQCNAAQHSAEEASEASGQNREWHRLAYFCFFAEKPKTEREWTEKLVAAATPMGDNENHSQ